MFRNLTLAVLVILSGSLTTLTFAVSDDGSGPAFVRLPDARLAHAAGRDGWTRSYGTGSCADYNLQNAGEVAYDKCPTNRLEEAECVKCRDLTPQMLVLYGSGSGPGYYYDQYYNCESDRLTGYCSFTIAGLPYCEFSPPPDTAGCFVNPPIYQSQ